MQTRKKNKNISECDEGKDSSSNIYINNCQKYDIKVDPSILIALETKWKVLQPTKLFGEGHLIPLREILQDNDHIEILRLGY